mmetsp:Transcript_1894/g.4711  ORF Transcript_1894/g.4711 Transcript_1894/m.4711 type:complete len:221 (+) Transcript_1894:1457-2119(+)
MVSSRGRMCTRLPYLTSGHWCTDTTSPRRTRRFFRTHLFMRILGCSHVSSARTMQTVSLRFLPLMSTVSPRKSCSASMVSVLRATTELSSLVASSTMRRLGDFLRSRMAVEKSFFPSLGASVEGPASPDMLAAAARSGGASGATVEGAIGPSRRESERRSWSQRPRQASCDAVGLRGVRTRGCGKYHGGRPRSREARQWAPGPRRRAPEEKGRLHARPPV